MTSRTLRSACFTSWSGNVSYVAGVVSPVVVGDLVVAVYVSSVVVVLAGDEIDVSGVADGISPVMVGVAGVAVGVSCVGVVAASVVVGVSSVAGGAVGVAMSR